jgi:hypothetical protein
MGSDCQGHLLERLYDQNTIIRERVFQHCYRCPILDCNPHTVTVEPPYEQTAKVVVDVHSWAWTLVSP